MDERTGERNVWHGPQSHPGARRTRTFGWVRVMWGTRPQRVCGVPGAFGVETPSPGAVPRPLTCQGCRVTLKVRK